jgi:hypothetical protein
LSCSRQHAHALDLGRKRVGEVDLLQPASLTWNVHAEARKPLELESEAPRKAWRQ